MELKIFTIFPIVFLLLVFGCRAQEKTLDNFDAFAFYRPYDKVVQVQYELPKNAPPEFAEGSTLSLQISDARGAEILSQQWKSNGKAGGFQIKKTLPDGQYNARLELAAGGSTLAAANPITVRKFEWENNGIGQERVVIPPFEKIGAQKNSATLWGREIKFGPDGLPQSINVLGKEILAPGGIKILLKREGKTEELRATTPFQISSKDGYDATGRAAGTLGPLDWSLAARLEYDGTYFVSLLVDAGEKAVPVESLTLLIPFAGPVDTYSFQKNDQDINGTFGLSRFGGILPEQKGVIFDARSLPKRSAYNVPMENYFVPSIYAGTGSRGLWFYADDDWDWYLNPEKEHATLERVNGQQVQLRVLLVNDATTWRGKRLFRFAVMPQPVKPMPKNWRKIAWSFPEDQYVHDTAGWRYYGDGVNAFTLPNDEEYRTLGKVLSGELPRPKGAYGQSVVRPKGSDKPLVMYGSSLMAGSGVANGEWEVFSSEWADPKWAQQPFDPDVKKRFADKKSYGGFAWDQDVSLKPAAVQWSDSWLDFALWYQKKLVSLSGVNGTFFDNQSGFTIRGIDENGLDRSLLENPQRFPIAGEKPTGYGRRYHTFQFRDYLKRLATMNHAVGRPPFWMINQHPAWSFGQIAWRIEADFYPQKGRRDLVEHLGVAGFRAHVSTQGGIIGRLQAHTEFDQPPLEGRADKYEVRLDDATRFHVPDVARTHAGLCLIHDQGLMSGRDEMLNQKLNDQFGFFDDEVEFRPYWEQKFVTVDSPRIYVSLFVHPTKKRAIAVVFNEKKDVRGITAPLQIAAAIEGFPIKSAHDLETGEPLTDLETGKPGLKTQFYVPPRDFRILVLE